MSARGLRPVAFALALAGAAAVWLILIQPGFGFDPLAPLREIPGARFWLFFAAMWALCGGLALGFAGGRRKEEA